MANPQHLEWLKEGVEAWNERRKKEPFKPDLQGAVLIGVNLIGADLEEANLYGADCRTYVYSAASTNDEFAAEYTNLSLVVGLVQHQLNAMYGDSGTIIPDDLTRPKDWPVLDMHKDQELRDGEVLEVDEQSMSRPLLESMPPAEFETAGEFPDIQHYPVRPKLRESAKSAKQFRADNAALATIEAVAKSLCTMLEKYEREAEAQGNRVHIAEQILSATRDLQQAISREEKLPTLIQIYVRVLKAASAGEDIEAMLDTEKALLAELVAQGEQYVEADELLSEINDPAILDKVPHVSAEEMDEVSEKLEDFTNSKEAKDHLTEEAIEVIDSETQRPAKEDATERRL